MLRPAGRVEPRPSEPDRGSSPVAPSTTPPAPPPGPSDQDQIRNVIRTYEQAFEQLDVGLYASIRPSLSAQNQNTLKESFRDLRQQNVSLSEPQIEVNGDRATASFQEKRVLHRKAGKDSELNHNVEMTLARTGGRWVIVNLSYR